MDNWDRRAALEYHEATKHSRESIGRSGHGLDWEIMPLPFKVYRDLEPIPLPRNFPSSVRAALAAIGDAGNATEAGPSLDLSVLARLFHFSAGVLRRRSYGSGDVYFRAQACTGNLHHVDLYLCCGSLPDLPAGVYHFSPHDFALRRLRAGDHRETVVGATGGEPAVAAAPAIVLCASTFWRNSWKYQARTYRHCFWDGGTLLANLLAVATAANLPARVVLGFADADVNRLLDLDGEREVAFALVTLGRGATRAPAALAVARLDLRTVPLSGREIDYPPIRAVHSASSLASGEQAAAWRKPIVVLSSPPPGPSVPLRPLASETTPAEPVESVILRRGSTRSFCHRPIGIDALSTLLGSVTGGVPADFLDPGATAVDLYLIVNAVDDLEAGAYFLDRQRKMLILLRRGSFRHEAGQLALGQSLAADAAVNLYWLADLQPVLEQFGNRGYRAAQLEAAIRGGKAYLAAFALGIGATGLTFFDDDVTAFFSPHAAGKSVMFLMALGMPERRRRRG